MCDGETAGFEPDKGSAGSCGPVYLHGNIPTGSHARTKDESEPPFARALATRAIARSPVQRTVANVPVNVHVNRWVYPCVSSPAPYASPRRHVRMRGRAEEVLRSRLKM